MRDNFAIFILSHGRPDRVYTVQALEEAGYTGNYYIVCDDEDEKIDEYRKNFGDKVLIFDKQRMCEKAERGDNLDNRKVVLYARNKCFEFAEDLGYQYFMEFDDDYTDFNYRFDENFKYIRNPQSIEDLDFVIDRMIDFFEKSGADTITFAQPGDFLFGKDTPLITDGVQIKRKAMNTFLCSVDRPFQFRGSINEDVNSYVRLQQLGKLMFMVNFLAMNQKETQSNKSGMTDIYLNQGTYRKSFHTILYAPSCVELMLMGTKYKRIHHYIKWRNAVPKIMSEEYKK